MCTMAEIHQKPSKHSMRTVYCHNRVSINGVTSAKFVYKCYARSRSGLPIQVHWWWQCWTSSYHDPSKQMGGYWWSGKLVIALPIKSSITELTFVNHKCKFCARWSQNFKRPQIDHGPRSEESSRCVTCLSSKWHKEIMQCWTKYVEKQRDCVEKWPCEVSTTVVINFTHCR